ncbi:hypothetical protein D1872_335460 [compost metagenome]
MSTIRLRIQASAFSPMEVSLLRHCIYNSTFLLIKRIMNTEMMAIMRNRMVDSALPRPQYPLAKEE